MSNVIFVEENQNQMVSIGKVLELYEKELRQFRHILELTKEGAGDLVNIEGSIEEFRKKFEEV